MKFSKLLSTFTFMMVLGFAASRVRPPKSFRHPPVLKRPPPSLSSNAKTTTTSTTPEPPEVDDEATPYATRSYNTLPYYDYDPSYDMGFFGYGLGGGGMTGGGSFEVEEEATPTRNSQARSPGRNSRGRQQPRPPAPAPAATTAKPAKKPTTPEPDDDLLQAGTSGGAGSSGGAGASGYCFCSPLSVCPHGSISRGGFCWNILSYLTNLTYQRCCYRPSIAKWIFH